MIDDVQPLTDEQREALAKDSFERVKAAIADYLRATKAEGDAEVLTDAIVLYEATGIDAETGEQYTRTNYFGVSDNPKPSTILGILEIAGNKLREVCL